MTTYEATTGRLWPAPVLVGLILAFGYAAGADLLAGVPQSPAARDQAEYRLTASPIPAGTRSTYDSGLRVLASGSERARIVDQDRKVVRSAPPGGTIFSFQTSPSGEYVLIFFGSAKYSIASADTFADLLTLPRAPPVHEDATGFSWRFLDDDLLLGSASLPSTDTAGKTMAEIEGLPPRAVLLYVYSWKTGQLAPVEVDESLPEIFFVYDVLGWNVTLLTYDDDLVGAKIVRSPASGDTNPP